MRIGLMGGTFDPIHIGHLAAAEYAREAAGLDEVWFMPALTPPHKDKPDKGAAPEQRLEMVNLAAQGHPAFQLCDIEIRKGGISFSVDTVRLLKKRYPEHEFYFIIGADMVQYLPKWYKIDELLQMVVFIGLRRPGYVMEDGELPPGISERAVVIYDMPQIEVSSTWIRSRIDQGQSIRYWVPEAVREYIEVNRLYGYGS